MPTFGRDSIRRFSNNISELKKLGARDYENLLQVWNFSTKDTLQMVIRILQVLDSSVRRSPLRPAQCKLNGPFVHAGSLARFGEASTTYRTIIENYGVSHNTAWYITQDISRSDLFGL